MIQFSFPFVVDVVGTVELPQRKEIWMNSTQRSTMVTVVRAWLRSYGIVPVLAALSEAIRREQRSQVYVRKMSRN